MVINAGNHAALELGLLLGKLLPVDQLHSCPGGVDPTHDPHPEPSPLQNCSPRQPQPCANPQHTALDPGVQTRSTAPTHALYPVP